jgi:hypothetical protein
MATATIELQRQPQHRLSFVSDNSSTLEQLTTNDAPDDAHPALRPVTRRWQLTVLLAAFLDVFLTIGINQSYGVYLAYYTTTGSSEVDPFLPRSEPQNKALLALVGTLGAGLTWGGSIFVNPIMARTKDLRWVTGSGAVLIGIGYIAAGSCHSVSRLLWDICVRGGCLCADSQ